MDDNCNHHYDDGKGAVEVFGGAETALKPMRVVGVMVDAKGRGYCKLCGKLTKANVPLEKCNWYKKVRGKWDSEHLTGGAFFIREMEE